MIDEMNTPVTDLKTLIRGFALRDGFEFTLGKKAAVYDTLVIRSPEDAVGLTGRRCRISSRTLEEHIALVNRYQLENAKIFCRDLSFITKCPTLKNVDIIPDDNAGDNFDYSPLYQLPQLKRVHCSTVYGTEDQYKCSVDYSQMGELVELDVSGDGHIGYERIPTLEILWISRNKKHKHLDDISCSNVLKDLTLLQTAVQTLKGIEKCRAMQSVALYHNRALADLSSLERVAGTLRALDIESCGKITDFSVLEKLTNLEHLRLYGSQTLPNLEFLCGMKKLKTFTFTMDVEDGNLEPCEHVPYVSCRNRKHFNRKDAQLPKEKPKEPFQLY